MSEAPQTLNSADVRQICLENGLKVDDQNWNQLENWATLLQENNDKINLISRKEIHLLWQKHILPCLALLFFKSIPEGAEVCDFGTGGGLPGMPLAIIRPDLKWTLLDSRQKKIGILQQMIDELQLKNANTLLGRGEDLGKLPDWRHRFPILTARAVAPLLDLANWTSGLRQPNAQMHIFKGGEIKDEINAISRFYPKVKIKKTLMVIKGYPEMAENRKYLLTLDFLSSSKYK